VANRLGESVRQGQFVAAPRNYAGFALLPRTRPPGSKPRILAHFMKCNWAGRRQTLVLRQFGRHIHGWTPVLLVRFLHVATALPDLEKKPIFLCARLLCAAFLRKTPPDRGPAGHFP
jgi:hypothetical protein